MLQTLDTVIGVIFVFLLFSLVVSAAQEVVAAAFRLRGRALKTGLDAMLKSLGGDKLAKDFWSHAFIASLQPTGKTPSYIHSENIATALLHIAAGNKAGEAVDVAKLKSSLPTLAANGAQANLATVLATLLEQAGAGASLVALQASVAKWVDVAMERVSSMYQRHTRLVLLFISLVFAGVMNIDAVTIWQHVQSDKALRETLVAQAEKMPAPTAPVTPPNESPAEEKAAQEKAERAIKNYQDKLQQFTDLGLPIGWTADAAKGYHSFWSGTLHVFGILLSAFAASLGAPFWFDLLQRFMNIRSVIKPAVKPVEPSKPVKPAGT